MIISVEGNIGAGKTTILGRIGRALKDAGVDNTLLYEPVDDWMNAKVGGKSMLELYYSDKLRYGFMFQMFVLQTRMQHMLQCLAENPGKVIVTERCHITDCEIFAKMLQSSNLLDPAELYVYMAWYDMCCKMLDCHLKGIVYLRATPSTCVERIIKRSRPGEGSISLDYIRTLHDAHESWIYGHANATPVSTVNADLDETSVDVSSVVEFVKSRVASVGSA